MPQMSPMNWLILFIMFITVLMIFNSMNYFSFQYKPLLPKMKFKSLKNNWKW